MDSAFLERLWAKVDKRGPDECWPWQARRSPKGYGDIAGPAGKSMLAHRAVWSAVNGEIPAGLVVCHRCDNPPCCNPAHLFSGTVADNNADMMAKGRNVRVFGERHGAAILDEAIVAAMRAGRRDGLTFKALGQQYGVKTRTVRAAVRGQTWKHLPGAVQEAP